MNLDLFELSIPQLIAISLLPVLFAITIHEVAHGWMAHQLGDDTAFRAGRITLNPFKHIDPIGTLLVPLAMLVISQMIFGWAKPVPVNFQRLHKPRRDIALVALAGPVVNLILAIFWTLIAKLGLLIMPTSQLSLDLQNPGVADFLILTGTIGIFINILLSVLNLVPILPLDGGRVVHSLLPPSIARRFSQLEPFGLLILLTLMFTGLLNKVLVPPVFFLSKTLMQFIGL